MVEETRQHELQRELDQLRTDLDSLRGDLGEMIKTVKKIGRQGANSAVDSVHGTIEQRPLVSVLAAVGAGLLLGKLMSEK